MRQRRLRVGKPLHGDCGPQSEALVLDFLKFVSLPLVDRFMPCPWKSQLSAEVGAADNLDASAPRSRLDGVLGVSTRFMLKAIPERYWSWKLRTRLPLPSRQFAGSGRRRLVVCRRASFAVSPRVERCYIRPGKGAR